MMDKGCGNPFHRGGQITPIVTYMICEVIISKKITIPQHTKTIVQTNLNSATYTSSAFDI